MAIGNSCPGYRDDFNEAGIDLIQLFSWRKNGKNGADMRLDVAEDINHYSHITQTVILAGDSDYIGLAQKVKQSGRRIIGIGVRESTNQFWVKCSNEFKYYQTLIDKSGHRVVSEKIATVGVNVRDAEKLLIDAVKRLVSDRSENRLPKGQLKGLMMRMDPTFDEANFGCKTFSAFLEEFSKVVTIQNGNSGYVSLIDRVFEKESLE